LHIARVTENESKKKTVTKGKTGRDKRTENMPRTMNIENQEQRQPRKRRTRQRRVAVRFTIIYRAPMIFHYVDVLVANSAALF
jgi:hypothetical protein